MDFGSPGCSRLPYKTSLPAYSSMEYGQLACLYPLVPSTHAGHKFRYKTCRIVNFLSSQKLLAAMFLENKSIMRKLAVSIQIRIHNCENCQGAVSAMTGKPALGQFSCHGRNYSQTFSTNRLWR